MSQAVETDAVSLAPPSGEEVELALEALALCADAADYVVIDPNDPDGFVATKALDSIAWASPTWLLCGYPSMNKAEAAASCFRLRGRYGEHLMVCSIAEAIVFAKSKGWL